MENSTDAVEVDVGALFTSSDPSCSVATYFIKADTEFPLSAKDIDEAG